MQVRILLRVPNTSEVLMSKEQFLYFWKSGFRIKRILQELEMSDFETEEILSQFKAYFLETILKADKPQW